MQARRSPQEGCPSWTSSPSWFLTAFLPAHSVNFKELVSSYKTGNTSFGDLTLEVRCESCFTSVIEEAQQQLGDDSEILNMLADEFPIYHKRLIKEQKLDFWGANAAAITKPTETCVANRLNLPNDLENDERNSTVYPKLQIPIEQSSSGNQMATNANKRTSRMATICCGVTLQSLPGQTKVNHDT